MNGYNPAHPYGFRWHVSASGYQWRLGRTLVDKGPHWIDADDLDSERQSPEQFNPEPEWGLQLAGERFSEERSREDLITTPLEGHPELFKNFASLEPENRNAILGFANNYGLLGQDERHVTDPLPADWLDRVPNECKSDVIEYLTGKRAWKDVRAPLTERERYLWSPNFVMLFYNGVAETHWTWLWAIRKMRAVVRLWELVRERDRVGLNEILACHYLGETSTSSKKGSLRGWFLNEPINPPKREVTQVDLLGTSYTEEFITELWNFKPPCEEEWGTKVSLVSGEPRRDEVILVATAFVQHNVAEELYRRVHTQLVVDPGTGNLVLKMHPDDLRAAMWLQFAQAIAGNKKYRPCRDCNKWFEVSADDDGRTDRRQFCEDACKSRDHRRRKARAVSLNAEGMSPEEIATRRSTEPDTIKKWVGKKRK